MTNANSNLKDLPKICLNIILILNIFVQDNAKLTSKRMQYHVFVILVTLRYLKNTLKSKNLKVAIISAQYLVQPHIIILYVENLVARSVKFIYMNY